MKWNKILVALLSCVLFGACQPKITDIREAFKSNKLKICVTRINGKNLYGVRHVDKGILVPVIYDKIEDDADLFIGEKDKIKSVYNIRGELLVDDVVEISLERAVPTYIRFDAEFKNKFYRLRTLDDSVYILIPFENAINFVMETYSSIYKYGPFQDFEIGINGFFYKENGKWGYRVLKKKKEEMLLEPRYDHILEVFDSYMCYYFLCDVNDKWRVYDIRGVEITDYPSAVNKRLLKAEKATTFRNVTLWKYETGMIRSGDGPVGIATFDPYKFDTDFNCHIRYQERVGKQN